MNFILRRRKLRLILFSHPEYQNVIAVDVGIKYIATSVELATDSTELA
jgi:hypothetical protein